MWRGPIPLLLASAGSEDIPGAQLKSPGTATVPGGFQTSAVYFSPAAKVPRAGFLRHHPETHPSVPSQARSTEGLVLNCQVGSPSFYFTFLNGTEPGCGDKCPQSCLECPASG